MNKQELLTHLTEQLENNLHLFEQSKVKGVSELIQALPEKKFKELRLIRAALSPVLLNLASLKYVYDMCTPETWAYYDQIKPNLPEYRELKKKRHYLQKAWNQFNGTDEIKKEKTRSKASKRSDSKATSSGVDG